jgi:ABC-type nitrate/sulfonate/bicarbonate transport system substrate-binding protein
MSYRRYENPHKVQKLLEEVQQALEKAEQEGREPEDLIDLYQEVESLKERLNFAWQDEEYDENYANGY